MITYDISKTSNNSVKIIVAAAANLEVSIKKITPITYVTSYVEPSIVEIGGSTLTYTANVATLIAGCTYTITFQEDGVYLINTVLSGNEYLHVFVSTDTLMSCIETDIVDLLCCRPLDLCKDRCEEYYDFTAKCILSLSYFGEDIDIRMNYGVVTSGPLYSGYKYKCLDVGSVSWDWKEGTIVLLYTSLGYAVTYDATLVIDDVYTCVHTGIPDDYGNGNADPSELTAFTDEFETKLNNIADAITNFAKYCNGCEDTTLCTC